MSIRGRTEEREGRREGEREGEREGGRKGGPLGNIYNYKRKPIKDMENGKSESSVAF
jgi:hypothetical protein